MLHLKILIDQFWQQSILQNILTQNTRIPPAIHNISAQADEIFVDK